MGIKEASILNYYEFLTVSAIVNNVYPVRPESSVSVRPERIWEAVLGGVGGILNVLQEAPAVSWLSPSEDKNIYISRYICACLVIYLIIL